MIFNDKFTRLISTTKYANVSGTRGPVQPSNKPKRHKDRQANNLKKNKTEDDVEFYDLPCSLAPTLEWPVASGHNTTPGCLSAFH